MSNLGNKILESFEKFMEKCREKELYQTMFYIKVVSVPLATGVMSAVIQNADEESTIKDKIVGVVYIGTGLIITGLCALPAPIVAPITLTYDAVTKAIKNNKKETIVGHADLSSNYLVTGNNMYDFERKLGQQHQVVPAYGNDSPVQKHIQKL